MAVSTVQGAIASSTAAVTSTLSDRWTYVLVENEGSVAIWVRTDGTAATVAGDGCFYVGPNSSKLLANELPLWTQSATVIPHTANDWQAGDLYGQTANPGVSVSVILATGTTSQNYVVSGAG